MVDKYYRTMNKDSLDSYQQWISQEYDKANQYQE